MPCSSALPVPIRSIGTSAALLPVDFPLRRFSFLFMVGLRPAAVLDAGGASEGKGCCLTAGDAAGDGIARPRESAGLPYHDAAPGKALCRTESLCRQGVTSHVCAFGNQDVLSAGADGVGVTRQSLLSRGTRSRNLARAGRWCPLLKILCRQSQKKEGDFSPSKRRVLGRNSEPQITPPHV
jgi:hypothetical protein